MVERLFRNERKKLMEISHKALSASSAAFAIALLGFSLTAQAGKIISVPSASGAIGFGGWNIDNVDVVVIIA